MKMSIEMTSSRRILMLATLFLAAVVPMADFVIIPIIPHFFEDFSNQIGMVNYLLSGPTLAMLVSSLFAPRLMRMMSKKSILVMGTLMFSVSTIFAITVYNVYYIAFMRTLTGFSFGLMMVTTYAFIAELFLEEKTRGTLVGIYNGAMSAAGIVLGLVAGLVATQQWQSVFNIYWVGVPLLILVILLVPNTGREVASVSQGNTEEKNDKMNVKAVVMLCVSAVAISFMFNSFMYFMGAYVEENSLGSPVLTGTMSSVLTVGSLVVSLIFGFTYSKLKKGSNIPSYLLMVICYLLLYFFPSVPVALICSALMGAAFGNAISYFPMYATVIVPPSKAGTALGIVNAAVGFGTFVSTYAVAVIKIVLNVNTLTGIMPVIMVLAAIGTILAIISNIKAGKKPTNYTVGDEK